MTASLTNCTGDGLTIGANNVTLNCNGFTIDGDNVPGGYGVVVESTPTVRSNITVTNCTITEFDEGIRFVDVDGGSVIANLADTNRVYGINLTRATDITVSGNAVIENGDEGIHVSGKDSTCPSPHLGRNIIIDNQVEETAVGGPSGTGEAIYILCSDSNRIEANTTYLNSGPGVFVDETSAGNLILGNFFDNDGVTIRLSDNNSIIDNIIFDDASVTSPPARLLVDGGQANYAERNQYIGDFVTPDACVSLEGESSGGSTRTSNCNQDVFSICTTPEDASINSDSNAHLNNRFLRFSPASGDPVCALGGSPPPSTVDVYDLSQTLVGCDTMAEVNPSACSWWAFDEVCDDGTATNLGAVQSNASTWDLNNLTISTAQYYRANTGTIELSATSPVTVSSTGCLSIAAATTVELHPGTTIAGRFHAVVW